MFSQLKWNEQGLIINCCDEHESTEYGDCDKHPKIEWSDCTSLSAFAINKAIKNLVLVMFHDHWWRDQCLSNHLSNKNIFVSFPLNETKFGCGDCVPDYSI